MLYARLGWELVFITDPSSFIYAVLVALVSEALVPIWFLWMEVGFSSVGINSAAASWSCLVNHLFLG